TLDVLLRRGVPRKILPGNTFARGGSVTETGLRALMMRSLIETPVRRYTADTAALRCVVGPTSLTPHLKKNNLRLLQICVGLLHEPRTPAYPAGIRRIRNPDRGRRGHGHDAVRGIPADAHVAARSRSHPAGTRRARSPADRRGARARRTCRPCARRI